MPSITTFDIVRMRDKLFFEGEERARKLSAFRTLSPEDAGWELITVATRMQERADRKASDS